ncbi:MAG: 5-oxoprolinase subunit PxpA [Rhodospirillales bacterium]|nr:5-oxoprolinase subunit PxpA [Rhodospirillales bacterium]
MNSVDLNCDMGESFGAWVMGNDAEMLRIVSSANIACGFHAGDPLVMHKTLTLAKQNNVGVGAHPSFLDLWGFGRRPIQGERPEDIEKIIIYQVGAIRTMALSVGHPIAHVKAHGSLANMAAVDAELAMAVARAIRTVDRALIFVVMPGAETEKAGEKLGLRLAREIYADRTYDDSGNLTSRKLPGSVLTDPELAAERVLRMVEEQAITSVSGKKIPVRIDTICVHGDNLAAVAMAAKVRARLETAGVSIRPMAQLVG